MKLISSCLDVAFAAACALIFGIFAVLWWCKCLVRRFVNITLVVEDLVGGGCLCMLCRGAHIEFPHRPEDGALRGCEVHLEATVKLDASCQGVYFAAYLCSTAEEMARM